MILSPHFTRADLERSDFAARNGIANTIPEEQLTCWIEGLHRIVEPLKIYAPNLRITSAYRSEILNRRIGGSSNSQHRGLYYTAHRHPAKHVLCCAFDLDALDAPRNRHLFIAATQIDLPFDQLIWEFGDDSGPAWVHLSYVPTEAARRELLRTEVSLGPTGKRTVTYRRFAAPPAPASPPARLSEMVADALPLHLQSSSAGGSANV